MLKPDFYFDSIFQIPYDRLYDSGIRCLIYDIDNTLVSHYDKRPPVKIVSLINRLRKRGFQVGLLSNNTSRRVNSFNEFMGLPGSSKAAKPFTAVLRRVMEEMDANPQETAIIGDQLFADVWCGKRAGITTVLVKPITDKEFFTVRIKRGLERRMLKKYLKEHVNPL